MLIVLNIQAVTILKRCQLCIYETHCQSDSKVLILKSLQAELQRETHLFHRNAKIPK